LGIACSSYSWSLIAGHQKLGPAHEPGLAVAKRPLLPRAGR